MSTRVPVIFDSKAKVSNAAGSIFLHQYILCLYVPVSHSGLAYQDKE